MTAEAPPRLRADARRNLDRILGAATAAFADRGPDVPMEEIARLAGVGVGTLYRRFPAREALIRAVVQESLRVVLAQARSAAAEQSRAWDALVLGLNPSRELQLVLRLSTPEPAVDAPLTDPRLGVILDELAQVVEGLVRAAQREGTLRPDVGAGDVMHLFTLLLRGRRPVSGESGDRGEAAFERARAVILDGLRARPGQRLTGVPLPSP
jgi:AcrR family transcriptional regulator